MRNPTRLAGSGASAGCATCYEQCPVHAIDMIPEGQA